MSTRHGSCSYLGIGLPYAAQRNTTLLPTVAVRAASSSKKALVGGLWLGVAEPEKKWDEHGITLQRGISASNISRYRQTYIVFNLSKLLKLVLLWYLILLWYSIWYQFIGPSRYDLNKIVLHTSQQVLSWTKETRPGNKEKHTVRNVTQHYPPVIVTVILFTTVCSFR